MFRGIHLAPKPDAFCVTNIAWQDGDRIIPITEAYVGPDEHSSSGPFMDCGFRWSLFEGDSLHLFIWDHERRAGYPNDPLHVLRLRVFSSHDRGQHWLQSADLPVRGVQTAGHAPIS